MTDAEYCFLLISVAGEPPRRVVIQLHRSAVPKTCDNFMQLCREAGRTRRSHPVATYRGTQFHRIVPKFMVQGGDFTNFDGSGGYAVIGNEKTFADESFAIKHDRAFVVSMANRGKNTNGSQFFITLQATPHLDGKHVAFGQVVEGMDVVQSMVNVELEGTTPVMMQRIVIVDCGVGKGDDLYSSNDGSVEPAKKQKRKKHKKKRRSRRSESDDDSDSSSSSKERKRRKKHHKRKKSKSKRREYSSESSDESRHRRKKHHRR